jgi:Regulator of ribonuclease activity B
MNHPDDDNGDVLRRMESNGDDLSRARNLDFVVVFPDQASAEIFASTFRQLGHAVSIDFAETVKELPWDVTVVNHMVPSHQDITEFESLLQDETTSRGGRNDGWGCLSEQSPAN